MDANTLISTFRAAGYEVIVYRHNAMIPTPCVGVMCDEPNSAIVDAIRAVIADFDTETIISLLNTVIHARIDELGQGLILYFPSVKWPAADDEGRPRPPLPPEA